jgi:integrase
MKSRTTRPPAQYSNVSPPTSPAATGDWQIKRRVLADGTVKEYRYAKKSQTAVQPRAGDSLAALIENYQRSPNWLKLAPSTKVMYAIYLRELFKAGDATVTEIKRRDIIAIRDSIAATRGHGAAHGFIRAASAIFTWARRAEWVEFNPVTDGAEDLERGQLTAWTMDQARVAMERLPEHLRRVVVLALYTAARRGDLCAMTWSAYDGEHLTFMPQKTRRLRQSDDPLVVPCHPALKAELDAWRAGAVAGIGYATILTDAHGKPWKPILLSQQLPAALARIGLPKKLNVHGLRKLAAVLLAEAGWTTHEIAAVTGHHTLAMVQFYTESANRKRIADAAMKRTQATLHAFPQKGQKA